jgi:hypothetical protein
MFRAARLRMWRRHPSNRRLKRTQSPFPAVVCLHIDDEICARRVQRTQKNVTRALAPPTASLERVCLQSTQNAPFFLISGVYFPAGQRWQTAWPNSGGANSSSGTNTLSSTSLDLSTTLGQSMLKRPARCYGFFSNCNKAKIERESCRLRRL